MIESRVLTYTRDNRDPWDVAREATARAECLAAALADTKRICQAAIAELFRLREETISG